MSQTTRAAAGLAIIASALLSACYAHAQHEGDIRFSYDAGKISLRANDGQPATENRIWQDEFDVGGFFGQRSGSPGFTSELVEQLGVNPGDSLAYDVLDNLLFWDGAQFTPPVAGVHIEVSNNLGADTIISGDSGEQPGDLASPFANWIGEAATSGELAGDFHSHVNFVLQPTGDPQPSLGVYGLKLRLITSAAGVDPSDPFLIVFNFGLSDEHFAESLSAFSGLLSPILPGDFNKDGAVDAADYAVWRNGFDAEYSIEDYDLWRENYGRSAGSLVAGAATNIPEPASLAIAVLIASAGRVSNRKAR